MRFSNILAVLAVPILVSAQVRHLFFSSIEANTYVFRDGSAGSSSGAPPMQSVVPGQHLVEVGPKKTFTFTPNTITAKLNETVTFLFVQPTGFQHSITQSNFADPCTPLQGGFDSGLQVPGKQFTLTITNATQPIWFYCKQTNPLKHCGALGMVGGINIQDSGHTVNDFFSAAQAVGNNEGPQTASGGLTGIGAVATGPASVTPAPSSTVTAPTAAGSTSAATAPGSAGSSAPVSSPSGSAPVSSPSVSAGKLAVGAGSLIATLFALFALA